MKINNITSSYSNTKNNTNKEKVNTPSFGAKNPANSVNEFFKLSQGGPMTRSLFILNAFTFLLGSRIFASRDKDERRETIIRDIPTIAIAVGGVPAIEKTAAKIIEKKTGFTITEKVTNAKGKTVVNNINYNTIGNWYKYDENIKGGLDAFSQRINDMGGNVKKVYSTLSDSIKDQIKNLSDKNDDFIKQIKDVNNNGLAKEIKEALKGAENKAAKKAELFKTGSKIAGFATTLVLIGFVIPKINMLITNAIHKNDAKKEENAKKA